MATTNLTIRLDTQIKKDAEELFNDLGLSLSSAFNIFVRQALYEHGLPFRVSRNQPNKVTLAAMQEAIELANNPEVKHYSSYEDMIQDSDK